MCCSADCLLGFDTGLIGNLAPTFWRSVLTRPSGLAEMHCTATKILSDYMCSVGWDSAESIATRYGVDGSGIESRWGGIFRGRPDRPLGPPTLLRVGTGSFPEVKRQRRGVDHQPHLEPKLKKE